MMEGIDLLEEIAPMEGLDLGRNPLQASVSLW